MSYRVERIEVEGKRKYRLFNTKKKIYVNKQFNSVRTALNAARLYENYRGEVKRRFYKSPKPKS